ncbi:MAG: hypothetical protein LBG97_00275, partial [Coriobacteriales bacterium]|nr:hypothetical protein [Coriobacteriales bacterium]
QIKSCGVKKLLGYSTAALWLDSIKGLGVTALCTALIVDILLALLISRFSYDFIVWLLLTQLLVFIFFVLISSVELLVLKGRKTGDILKNAISLKPSLICAYVLKAVFLIVLSALLAHSSGDAARVIGEYRSQEQWKKNGNYSVVSGKKMTSDFIESIASGDARYETKFSELYDDFNDYMGGMYAASDDYPIITDRSLVKSALAGTYQTLYVNPNYLKELYVYDMQGNKINISESETQLVALLPESRESEADLLVEALDEFFSRSAQSEQSRLGKSDISTDIHVKSLIYKQHEAFFSFDDHVAEKDNHLLSDPVIIVLTKANIPLTAKLRLMNTGLTFPMKFNLSSDSAREKAKSILVAHGLDPDTVYFDTLKNLQATQLGWVQAQLFTFLAASILVFAFGCLSSFFLANIIVISKQRWLVVTKYLGYSLAARYKSEAIIFGILYLCMLGITLQFSQDVLIGLALSLALAVFDVLVTLIIIQRLETKRLAEQLKGA